MASVGSRVGHACFERARERGEARFDARVERADVAAHDAAAAAQRRRRRSICTRALHARAFAQTGEQRARARRGRRDARAARRGARGARARAAARRRRRCAVARARARRPRCAWRASSATSIAWRSSVASACACSRASSSSAAASSARPSARPCSMRVLRDRARLARALARAAACAVVRVGHDRGHDARSLHARLGSRAPCALSVYAPARGELPQQREQARLGDVARPRQRRRASQRAAELLVDARRQQRERARRPCALRGADPRAVALGSRARARTQRGARSRRSRASRRASAATGSATSALKPRSACARAAVAACGGRQRKAFFLPLRPIHTGCIPHRGVAQLAGAFGRRFADSGRWTISVTLIRRSR